MRDRSEHAWAINQFDVVAAYMLAKPSHVYYVRYPAGWGQFLQQKHGSAPFNPDDYYLRVDKNVYGRQESGLIWFKDRSKIAAGTSLPPRPRISNRRGPHIIHQSTFAAIRAAPPLPLRGSREPQRAPAGRLVPPSLA